MYIYVYLYAYNNILKKFHSTIEDVHGTKQD